MCPDEIIRLQFQKCTLDEKVSTLVILRRILDAGRISRDRFQKAYAAEVARLTDRPRAGGEDFYLTHPARLSRRFARALSTNTLEGQTLFRDAFHMLGINGKDIPRTWPGPGGAALMLYLLDTNIFIQGKNLHYGMDFCPAFSDLLVEQNGRGHVHSIEKVGDELAAGSDELSTWAAGGGEAFFLPPDQPVLSADDYQSYLDLMGQ